MPEIPGLDKAGGLFLGLFKSTASYMPTFITLLLVGLCCWFVLYIVQYKYSVEVFVRRGSGSNDFSIGKIKKNRIKEIKNKDGTRKWFFLKGKQSMAPLDDKYILPGNRIKLFQVNDSTFLPINFVGGNPEAEFSLVTDDTKFWMMNEISRAAQDYQTQSGWEKFQPYFVMIVTVIGCLTLVGITIYFAFQDASQITGSMDGLTTAIKGMGSLSGVAPG